ncbi:MAG: DUF2336 domain-containing protein [Alphaproteobacteria bacterium]
MTANLSRDDVGTLLSNPTTDVRVMTARRVAADFARPALTLTERNLAIDLFRMLARDPDEAVRRALARALRDEPLVPHDVVQALALDDVEVATPVLEHSIVLPDEDLIEVVESRGAAHQIAVARRSQISPLLAETLAETRAETVILTLLRNPGAEIAESTYDAIVRSFPAASPVIGAVTDHRLAAILRSAARHPSMPVFLAERLVHRVAEKVRAALGAIEHLPAATIDRLVTRSRERATVALLRHGAADQNATLAHQLGRAGRLTVSLLARAYLDGHVDFVATGLALASGETDAKVAAALARRQINALAGIAEAAGMPDEGIAALSAIVKAARATKYAGGLAGLDAFRARVLASSEARDADSFVTNLGLEGSRLDAPDEAAAGDQRTR